MITFSENNLRERYQYFRVQQLIQEIINDRGLTSREVEQIVKMYQFKQKHAKQFNQLTEREIEVLELLANGFNNPQIAETLFLSRQTVETHRKNIKRKLNLRSLLDLMRYAFAFDLIN